MKVLKGVAASAGIVIGRTYHVEHTKTEVVFQAIIGPGQVVAELHRLDCAVDAAERDLRAIKERVEKELPAHLYLIEAHLMILRDQMFYQKARQLIEEEMINAEWAVVRAVKQIEEQFARIDDPYLRNRVEDVEAVADRVLRFLAGQTAEEIGAIQEKAILVAHNLSPADTTQIDLAWVMGFVTEVGSRTSHTAIVAKSLAIPAVLGLEKAMERVPGGTIIIVDGIRGEVIVDPDEETLLEYHTRQERYESYSADVLRKAQVPAQTVDGQLIHVLANIEQTEEAASALEHGAEGIGLFRTEFLYLNQAELPTEEQLYQLYRRAVELLDGRPVTIRTLDLGGDKFAHHFDLVPEMNPAMGLRATRLCLRRPDIFRVQLKAVLRASGHGPVRIMFPLISGVQEMLDCRLILEECKIDLKAKNIAFDPEVKVGCMIEVPSAVLMANVLARHSDFFSIGTNDLIQYSLAIDRVNEYVAHMYQPFHPAVLKMVKVTIDAAQQAGIQVALCGELAGEPGAIPLLLGLGLKEISANPQALPRVKQIVRMADTAKCVQLAKNALECETAAQVTRVIDSDLSRFFPDTFDSDGRMLF